MKHLFEVQRKPKAMGNVAGCVVNYSDKLILVHRLEWDSFRLDGYTLIRDEDIRLFRFFDKPTCWQYRAEQQLGLKAVRPGGVSVASLPEFLTSAAKHFPLLFIHLEKRDPDIGYLGELASVSEKTFTIEELNFNADWIGPRRFRFADVTRVDFGGGYERALAATAPQRKQSKR